MSEPRLYAPSLFLATLALSLATFMQVLDSHHRQRGAADYLRQSGVSAVGDMGYHLFAVCNAIALPLTGWFTRRFGQLRLFIASR